MVSRAASGGCTTKSQIDYYQFSRLRLLPDFIFEKKWDLKKYLSSVLQSWLQIIGIILMTFVDEQTLVSLCEKMVIFHSYLFLNVSERENKLELQTNFDLW